MSYQNYLRQQNPQQIPPPQQAPVSVGQTTTEKKPSVALDVFKFVALTAASAIIVFLVTEFLREQKDKRRARNNPELPDLPEPQIRLPTVSNPDNVIEMNPLKDIKDQLDVLENRVDRYLSKKTRA